MATSESRSKWRKNNPAMKKSRIYSREIHKALYWLLKLFMPERDLLQILINDDSYIATAIIIIKPAGISG